MPSIARSLLMSRCAPLALMLLIVPSAVAAQQSGGQTGVEDSSKIDGFRLDQPAGPSDPARPASTTPRAPAPTQPTRTQPPRSQAQAERTPSATPASTPAARTNATPKAAPTRAPAGTNATTRTFPATEALDAEAQNTAPSPAAQDDVAPVPQAVSETIADDASPPGPTAIDTSLIDPMVEPLDTASDTAPSAEATSTDWAAYWPYAAGAGAALLLLFGLWLMRRRSQVRGNAAMADTEGVAASEPSVDHPPLDLTGPIRRPASQPDGTAPTDSLSPEPALAPVKPAPSGTIGIPIAKVVEGLTPPAARPTPAPLPAPSAASKGFVTTRAPKAEAPRPSAPSGTVGIPASRIAPPAEPSAPSAPQLVEGTRLAAQFAAPELIRDDDGLRLRFALGIGNIGTMAAKDVQLRTVLLTAAPDSDRALADWMGNPNGPAVTQIPLIEGGTQTNITGEIQLTADQISAMTLQGQAIFVPMMAISVDYLGAEGLDRFGEAYVIGLPPERGATNGKARVLPLPHDGKLPRRWTDLLHSKAAIG